MRALCLLLLLACPPEPDKTDSSDTGPAEDTAPEDPDGDGFTGQEDCDEENPEVHAGAEEQCDGLDNDCDGDVDEDLLETVYLDDDGDGFGDPERAEDSCEERDGWVSGGSDCDDGDAEVHPEAQEICDGIDNDCDGLVDHDDDSITDPSRSYLDDDGDGYGDADSWVDACSAPSGYVDDSTDCDDTDPAINPGAEELAGDEFDNDCDGWVDIDADMPETSEAWTVQVYADGIESPMAMAFDSKGTLYVGQDEVDGQIHAVAPGGGTADLFGPEIEDPDAVAVGSDDTVYIGSEEGLYRVTSDGTAELFVTDHMGNNTFVVVDFDGVFGDAGQLFVANARASADIVEVSPVGDASSFVSNSSLYVPFGLCFDESLLYVTEVEAGLAGVYTVDASGTVTSLATKGLNTPHGIVYDPSEGLFFVGDRGEDRIYTMTSDGTLTLFAEGVSPRGFALDDDGNLYVSDHSTDPDRILRFEPPA